MAKERSGVIAAGNWIVDHVKLIDVYPVQDSLANIREESVNNGGSPYNVLKDLAKMDAPFPLEGIGLVGEDPDGRWIKDDCKKHGIDCSAIQTFSGVHTSYTDVMTVTSTGRRTFFHQRGVNAYLDTAHFNFSATRAKLFHLGYLLLLDALDKIGKDGLTGASNVLNAAVRTGLKTSIDIVSEDSNRFQEVILPALPFVHYLFINEFEAERCTGVELTGDIPDLEALTNAADKLLDSGVKEWVIIHFSRGVFAKNKDGINIIKDAVKVPDEKIVSTVGAGDAFAAGTLFGVHENWDMNRAIELGVCTAAASLFDVSCSGGIINYKECLKLGYTD